MSGRNLIDPSRNPRAHGTRVCTEGATINCPTEVAIHVLMEHAFVRPLPDHTNRRVVAIHVLMEHAFVRFHRAERWRFGVAIHVLMEHAFVLLLQASVSVICRNPRAHGTRVCTLEFAVRNPGTSQSTCSWNTRLNIGNLATGQPGVAIHVLMEHAFVRC